MASLFKKNLTSKQVALIVTLVFAFFVLALAGIIIWFHFNWILILVALPIFLPILYFLTYIILNRFIYDRIRPIYKTIHELGFSEKMKGNTLNDIDIISRVTKEVSEYKKNQADEIAKLKELEKYRKEFLGNVSHELKTPIFNIQGYILTLLEGGMDDSSILELYLKRAEKSIDRMISIVQDLETISKLEAGVLKLTISNFSIVKLVEEVYELEQMRAHEKKIKLAIAPGIDKSIKVCADKERIMQALTNLVVNAIKYGKEKGKISFDLSDMDNNVLVEISDDGIGIEKENLPRIFERFYRVDKSRSREQGGTGLGLSIVKHIIEAHDQRITVTSEINKGTTFAFTLPKAK